MSSAFEAYRERRHFASLHGLRFLCIAAVLWHHGFQMLGFGRPTDPKLLSYGFLGVDMFFVLSGFLITTLLLREEDRTGRFSLRAFYWRRALRILPVYYFVVLAVAGWFIVVGGEHRYLELLPAYLLFLQNFLQADIPNLGITWSLAVEEQFYLVWPALLLLAPRRRIVALLAIAMALNVAIAEGVFHALFGWEPWRAGPLVFDMFTATYLPILLGALIAILLHRQRVFEALLPVLGHPLAAPLALLAVPVTVYLLPDALKGWPLVPLHLSMGLLLVTLVIREDHRLAPVLTLAPIVRLGEISYGIYLYHLIARFVAIQAVAALGIASGAVQFALYLCLSIFLAEISFRTLERFFLGFKHRVPGMASGALGRP